MDCVDVPLECQSLRRELRLELKEDRGERHCPAPELNQQLTRMVVKQLLGADAEGTRGCRSHIVVPAAQHQSSGLLTDLHLLAESAQLLLDHQKASS